MLQLTISPKAEIDLIGIWVYTCEQWDVDQADKYLDQLDSGMKRLIEHPSLGADYTHVFPEYRRLQIEQEGRFKRAYGSRKSWAAGDFVIRSPFRGEQSWPACSSHYNLLLSSQKYLAIHNLIFIRMIYINGHVNFSGVFGFYVCK